MSQKSQKIDKSVFTRVANYANNTFFVYNDNKVLYDNTTYQRTSTGWSKIDAENKYEYIGFVPFEVYSDLVNKNESLQKEIEKLALMKNKQKKYRSAKNFDQQEKRIKTVMKCIGYIKTLGGNFEEIDDKVKVLISWNNDQNLRIKELGALYKKAIEKNPNKKVTYSYYRQLSIYKSLYEDKYESSPDNNYSQFYMDFKQAINKSSSEVTKFCKKIELFTEVFNLLPPGAWAICDIPLTYWLLIYREFWEEIIKCIRENKKFPYDKISEIRVSSLLDEIDLSQEREDEEEDDEVEEVEEEFDEVEVDKEVVVVEIDE